VDGEREWLVACGPTDDRGGFWFGDGVVDGEYVDDSASWDGDNRGECVRREPVPIGSADLYELWDRSAAGESGAGCGVAFGSDHGFTERLSGRNLDSPQEWLVAHGSAHCRDGIGFSDGVLDGERADVPEGRDGDGCGERVQRDSVVVGPADVHEFRN